jgi:hypothetical protein
VTNNHKFWHEDNATEETHAQKESTQESTCDEFNSAAASEGTTVLLKFKYKSCHWRLLKHNKF